MIEKSYTKAYAERLASELSDLLRARGVRPELAMVGASFGDAWVAWLSPTVGIAVDVYDGTDDEPVHAALHICDETWARVPGGCAVEWGCPLSSQAADVAELIDDAVARVRGPDDGGSCGPGGGKSAPFGPLVRYVSRKPGEPATDQAARSDAAFLASVSARYLDERGIASRTAEYHSICIHECRVEVHSGYHPVLQVMACRSSPSSSDWEIVFSLLSDRSRVGAEWPMVSLPVGLNWHGAEPELRALVDRAIELTQQREAA